MSQLTPCPECQRHVRKTEARCPFCDSALSLAHVPAPVLPRARMGRAATFAFGASVVGATALVGCTLEDPGGNVAVYGAPPAGGAGGSSSGGSSYAGSAVYGSPPAGSPSVGGVGGSADGGAASALYGGAPADGGSDAGGAPPNAGAGGEAGGDGGSFALYGGPPGVGGAN
jgi:hypothetical protein